MVSSLSRHFLLQTLSVQDHTQSDWWHHYDQPVLLYFSLSLRSPSLQVHLPCLLTTGQEVVSLPLSTRHKLLVASSLITKHNKPTSVIHWDSRHMPTIDLLSEKVVQIMSRCELYHNDVSVSGRYSVCQRRITEAKIIHIFVSLDLSIDSLKCQSLRIHWCNDCIRPLCRYISINHSLLQMRWVNVIQVCHSAFSVYSAFVLIFLGRWLLLLLNRSYPSSDETLCYSYMSIWKTI